MEPRMAFTSILSSPLGLVVIVYFTAAIVGALLVHPMRRGMVRLARDLLDEERWSDDQRAAINLLIDTCMSFRVGVLIPIAAINMVGDELLERKVSVHAEMERLWAEPRYHSLFSRYVVSIFVANLFAGAVSLVLVPIAGGICAMIRSHRSQGGSLRSVIEESVYRASHSMIRSDIIRVAAP